MAELLVLLTWATPFLAGLWALRLLNKGGPDDSDDPPPPDPGPPPPRLPTAPGPQSLPTYRPHRDDRDAVARSARRPHLDRRSTPSVEALRG